MAMELYDPMRQRFDEQQIQALNQPLQETRIKERESGNGKLKYLKADDVIGVANEIFGYGRWGYKVVAREDHEVSDPKKGPVHIYTADIELSVVGCPFTFPGDGVGVVNKPFTVEMHEKARKEATSDALKRALRHYGDQFGLCLYNEDDMVEGADGTMKAVKDAKQQQPGQKPKRVVDDQKRVALDNDIKQRLNKCFDDLRDLGLLTPGKNNQENATAFFKLLSEILGTPIVAPQDLTEERFKAVEDYIGLKIEKKLGVPA